MVDSSGMLASPRAMATLVAVPSNDQCWLARRMLVRYSPEMLLSAQARDPTYIAIWQLRMS